MSKSLLSSRGFLLTFFFYQSLVFVIAQEATFETAIQVAYDLKEAEEYKAAAPIFEEIIAKWETKIHDSELLGKAYHNLGVTYYNLKKKEAAIQNYQCALSVRSEILPPFHKDILKSNRNIGNCYLELEEFAKAQNYYQKVIDLGLQNSDLEPCFLASIYLEQSYVLSKFQDFKQAEDYLKLGVELTESCFPDDFDLLYHAYNRASLHYGEREDAEKIIEAAEKNRSLFNGYEDELEDIDSFDIANAYANMGIGYDLKEDYPKAIEFYQKSINWNNRYKSERHQELANTSNNLANLYRNRGNPKIALENIEQAIAYRKLGNRPQELALHYYNRGEIYFDLGDFEKALADYQKSLELYVIDFVPKDILNNPSSKHLLRGSKKILIDILSDKANILNEYGKQKGDLSIRKAALATYDTTVIFIDQMRMDFQSDESKSFTAEKAKHVFEQALRLSLDLYKRTKQKIYQDKAFEYIERSKALVLLEAVHKSGVKKITGLPQALLAEERQLKQNISRIEQQLFELEDAKRVETLHLQLVNYQRRLELLVEKIEYENPQYYQLAYDLKLADIEDIQAQLEPQQAMLQYLLGKEHLYWFYIDANTIKSGIDSLDFPIRTWITDFRASIYDPFLKEQTAQIKDSLNAVYANLGHQLYNKLIAKIGIDSANNRLVIIPDGVLGYIPFDALLESSGIKRSTAYDYLTKKYAISYNYSATLYEQLHKKSHTKQAKKLLAIAPKFENKKTQKNDSRFKGEVLTPLNFNEEEVSNLYQLIHKDGDTLLANNATITNFEKLAKDYQIIHFSTHGKANDQIGDYSYLAFSPTSDSINHSKLYVKELYNLELNADMIVLSACEMGLGEIKQGEGIIGMTRGFTYAGTKSIITTLWIVEEKRTQEFVDYFYRQIYEGIPKDIALQNTKLHLLEEGYPEPFYWAGFIPIGNVSSLDLRQSISTRIIGLIGGVLLLAILFFFLKKKNNIAKLYS